MRYCERYCGGRGGIASDAKYRVMACLSVRNAGTVVREFEGREGGGGGTGFVSRVDGKSDPLYLWSYNCRTGCDVNTGQ